MTLRMLGTALALLVASGCQQPDMGQPVGAEALFSGLDFTPMAVQDDIAMGVTDPAAIETQAVNTTVVAFMPNGCEEHIYRTIGGRVSAESICDGVRYVSQGLYSVRGDGAICMEWDNPNWDDSCAAWELQEDGRFRSDGDVEGVVYVGNIFGL